MPQGNQVMSGQGPAGVRPGNVVTPPAQMGPRPLRKRGRGPAPVPPGPGIRRRTY
jgi:hypothetical protein